MKLNKILLLLPFIALIACSSTEKKEIFQDNLSGQAILIGPKIELLNESLKPFESEKTLKEGTFVTLLGISDSVFQNTTDYCDAFNYIKIKSESVTGIIDGRNVYKVSNTLPNSSFQINNVAYHLKTTSFYGIGALNEEGLSYCSKFNQPIVIVNTSNNTKSLIHLLKNNFNKKITQNKGFEYFEFRADDGASDMIQAIKPIENGVVLSIKRGLQEGWSEYDVKLIIEDNNYKAEYLNYGEIRP